MGDPLLKIEGVTRRAPPANTPSVADFGVRNIFQPPDKTIESIAASGFFRFARES